MSKKSVADHSLEWFHLISTVGPKEVPYLVELLAELGLVRKAVIDLESERLSLIARKQQITRDLEALKNRGRTLAGRVRSGLKTKYGYDNEQLTQYGMKPRRRRVGQAAAEQEAVAKHTDFEPVS
ncbi:MAG TPA: hypothetical protein VN493_00460 [Thermoanaerobaculia bacterium]|nr:hypothetical protein [Thermoanaerobaculia bacterium]